MRCGASNSSWLPGADSRAASACSRSRPLDGRKPLEREPAGGDVAGHAQRGQRAARPGDRQHAVPGRGHRRHQTCAGVADRRRAGVADQGYPFAGRQALQNLAGRGGLVVLVQGQQRLVQTQVLQQGAADAGVLAGHPVGQGQHVDGAQGDVGQVADRRGDDVECAGRIAAAHRPPVGAACSSREDEVFNAGSRRAPRGDAAEARALAHLQRAGPGAGGAQLSGRARPAGARRRGRPDPARPRRHAGVRARCARAAALRMAAPRPASWRPSSARLVFAAQHYLRRLPTPPPCRFDVVALDGDRLEWLPAAFDAAAW